MSDETLSDIRGYVSDCFNHRGYKHDSKELDESGYMQLSRLMIEEYGLYHYDVDHVVGDIEDLIARYILEASPKFQDNDE